MSDPEPVPAAASAPAAEAPPGRARALLRAHAAPLAILAIFFAVFLAARIGLLLAHHADFASLTASQVAGAFLRGLRFDASMIFTLTFAGTPLVLLSLPFPWARSRLWRGIWGWLCFALLALFAFVLAADIIHFGYVHRHIAREVTVIEEDFDQTALLAVKEYWWAMIAYVAGLAGLFLLWRRILRPAPPEAGDWRWRLAALAAAGLLMYVGARGSLDSKRLKTIDAFRGGSPAAGYLALNGPFSMMDSRGDLTPLKVDFYPEADAERTARQLLFAPGERAEDPQYPLMRSRPAKERPKYNIVLVMGESWEAVQFDVYRRELGLPPLGCTPNFDRLAGQGILFTRFFASGQKSIDGMCSLLTAFPSLPRTPYLGHGLEQGRLPFLARVAPPGRYDTYFIQTEKRNSFRADAIAQMAGFRTFLGAQDIPATVPAGRGTTTTCGAAWDEEMWAEANRRFSAAKEPFLAFLYTGSTHAPGLWPDRKWEKFPPDSRDNQFRDSIHYADAALGKFFDDAKAAGYFDRTIFILTADHTIGGGGKLDDPPTLHHSPCLVIAPGVKPRVDRRVGGQLDIIPTIMDLAGWGGRHSSLGRSLFDDTAGADRGAFCVQGEMILRVEEGGWIVHDLKRRVAGGKYAESADLDAIERRLLSIMQAGAGLLQKNRLFAAE